MSFYEAVGSETSNLNPEQLHKTDLDIRSIDRIVHYAQANGSRAVVDHGYALDALLNVQVTRPHNDIDVDMYGPDSRPPSVIQAEVLELLNGESGEDWRASIKSNGHKIVFTEQKTDGLSDKTLRRKIEIDVLSLAEGATTEGSELEVISTQSGKVYTVQLIPAQIFDSEGALHKFDIKEPAWVVATKLMGEKSRPSKPSDLGDLKRLFLSGKVTREMCVERMRRRISGEEHLSPSQAETKAQEMVEKVWQEALAS